MKRICTQRKIEAYLSMNKWYIILYLGTLMLGVIFGSVQGNIMQGKVYDEMNLYVRNFVSAYNLQTVDGIEILKISVYNGIKSILILWISGLMVYFCPLAIIQVWAKGYKMGLTTAFFMRVFGARSILFSISALLPQLLIMVPVLIIYAVFNLRFSIALYRMRGQRISAKTKNELYFKNLVFLIIVVVAVLLYSLADAFVLPPILKFFCSFLNK